MINPFLKKEMLSHCGYPVILSDFIKIYQIMGFMFNKGAKQGNKGAIHQKNPS